MSYVQAYTKSVEILHVSKFVNITIYDLHVKNLFLALSNRLLFRFINRLFWINPILYLHDSIELQFYFRFRKNGLVPSIVYIITKVKSLYFAHQLKNTLKILLDSKSLYNAFKNLNDRFYYSTVTRSEF